MFEQDYIMRQIKEMIAVIMQVLFRVNLYSADELPADTQTGSDDNVLFRMIDRGEITAAEQMLYESIQTKDAANLLKGFSFYQYLAQKDASFLEQHGYSSRMLENGIRKLAALFHAADIAQMFFPD